jgi:hypothetical protein
MWFPSPTTAADAVRGTGTGDAPGEGGTPAAKGPARPPPLARIAFLHLSKTAGTSLTEVLARRWGRVWIVAESTELDAPAAAGTLRGVDLVAGHFYAHQLDLPALRGFAPVTVLRDPLDRLVSSWRFARACAEAGEPLTPAMLYASRVGFAEYAFSGIAAADRHAQLYILGVAPEEPAETAPLGGLLRCALRRLEGMRAVGVTEALPAFLDRLFAEAGAGAPPPLPRLLGREAPPAEDEGRLTRRRRAALEEVLAPDRALHAQARALLLRRLERPAG